MLFLRTILIACVISLSLFPLTRVNAQTSPPIGHGNVPGSDCLPANLQQAISLGLGWSQRGVSNNEALGGSSFFVVCPLSKQYGTIMHDVIVELERLAPGAVTPTCTLFRHDGFSPITQASNLFVFFQDSTFVNLTTVFSNQLWHPFSNSYSIVCALHPQTRLNTIYFRDDIDLEQNPE